MAKRRLALWSVVVLVVALRLPAFPRGAAVKAVGMAGGPLVVLVADDHPGEPVRHAVDEIARALEALSGTPGAVSPLSIVHSAAVARDKAMEKPVIVAGLSQGTGPAARLLRAQHIEAPAAPESLLIRRTAGPPHETWLVTAPDDRGLMYALLDIADRIRWAGNPAVALGEVRDAREAPAVVERAVSIYTMQRAWFESRFFDEKQWERYFDLLARNRFNSFVLIFGYENAGYFAPAYPYFFDVERFPGVRVEGFSAGDQRRYSDALHHVIALAHARGLSVTLGLWDHIYRGGVQAGGMDVQPGRPSPGIVTGLTQSNLMAYSQAALSKFVETFPDVDVLQFRMHTESGLKTEEMHDFWKDMYEIMRRRAPRMRFDARVKDLPDDLIDLAADMGINFRLSTKYWAEQVGLPFHPTHINRPNQLDRRHGYADLLRYPKKYDIDWQLWTAGTTRILLWGDPDYSRRFVASSHLYDGKGFEVNEMLATKMASQPHDMAPFDLLAPPYRYYDYEFERYWHFYQLFGRIGYNPDTPADVWDREFERRLGRETAPYVERALHRASWILPMITAYNFPYSRFPATRGWPERQRREDLPEYAKAEPSDTEQFLGMTEAARLLLAGGDSAKIWPQQSSRWFANVADEVSRDVAEAERRRGTGANPELVSTLVDLKILANLASYHSRRAEAGLAYALWEQTRDLTALDRAIASEARAIDAWGGIVRAASDVYAPNMRMGLARSDLTGHWRDELEALRRGLAALERSRQGFRPDVSDGAPQIAHVPVRRLRPGEDMVVEATVSAARPIARVQFAYRVGDRFGDVPLERTGPFAFRARVPATRFGASFSYIIHASDETGRTATWPAPSAIAPGQAVVVSDDEEPPRVRHVPVTTAPAARPLHISAEVTDRSGIKWVRLRYRGVNQYEDYKTLEMRSTAASNQYEAVVPASDINPRFDFMYFLEVMDNAGNGAIYPDLRTEQPYVIVRLDRGPQPSAKSVRH
jgi:hypothetical protein